MDDEWKSLQAAALRTLKPMWNDFAKEGKESAVLAPLGRYPKAAGWLAESMGMSDDYIIRKLGAMLAGWIFDPQYAGVLPKMLDRERKLFPEDDLSANSVAEDIMFAATRWTVSKNLAVRNAGINVLVGMVTDALEGTPWNTVHWAVANLYRATDGKHEILDWLMGVPDAQMDGQKIFQNAVKAIKQRDMSALNRVVILPAEELPLDPDDPNYSIVSALWSAAAAVQAAAR